MQIVKKDSFRSQGSAVNKTDDMYRVVVDMKRTEYPQFAKLVEGQKPTTNKQSTPCKKTGCDFNDKGICVNKGNCDWNW